MMNPAEGALRSLRASTTELLNIPNDVLENCILKQLGPSGLLACAFACSRLHQISARLAKTATPNDLILQEIFRNGYLNLLQWVELAQIYPKISELAQSKPFLHVDSCLDCAAEGQS